MVANVTNRGMVTAAVVAVWMCGVLLSGCSRDVDGGSTPVADPTPVGYTERPEAGFAFTMPPGWAVRDPEGDLIYGDVAVGEEGSDASIVLLGSLDGSLFASSEDNNQTAASELGTGMGEFFFPDSGTRVDEYGGTLTGAQTSGAYDHYRVEFDDTSQRDAEVFSAVVESAGERWWVVWMSTEDAPIDVAMARELAESIVPI
jgi:hypothetical protein